MIVLHGGYLPAFASASSPGFFVWGEGLADTFEEKGRHPRALSSSALEATLRADGIALPHRPGFRPLTLTLPSFKKRPAPSAPALRDTQDYAVSDFSLRSFELDALVVPPGETLDLLLDLPDARTRTESTSSLGDDLDYWCEAGRFVFDLLRRRRLAPVVEDGMFLWRAALSDSFEKERFERFAEAMPSASRVATDVRAAGKTAETRPPTAEAVLRAFVDDVLDATARHLVKSVLPPERLRAGGGEERALVASLASAEGAGPEMPRDLWTRLRAWLHPLLEPPSEGELKLWVKLSPAERESDGWSLIYGLAPADDPSLRIPAEEVWTGTAPGLRRVGVGFANPELALLTRLSHAGSLSIPIARSLNERHPSHVELSAEEVHAFLTSEAPLLSEAGVEVLLPSGGHPSRIGLELHVAELSGSGSAVTRFGLATLVDFDWRVAIGDVRLTPQEFEELAARKIPLVEVHGAWMLLDPEAVTRALHLLERRPGGRTTLANFLKLAGGLEAEGEEATVESVEGSGWLGELLANVERVDVETKVPATLTGTLRPYQVRGLRWLRSLLSRGLGACLADDMGLGKTVQFLSALLSAREVGEEIRPSLLVCPTSVAENWVREAARFAPSLSVAVHHGPERASGSAFLDQVASVDLLVTTYPLAHRDRALLAGVAWEYVALDEAQNVKNPAAAQSRAVRALKARRRAALTGTPVENRLAELRAIFDFLSPGLLGSDESFRTRFAVPIERHRDPEAAERLRRITRPFLLRRTKTDPAIAPDLPEKIETREWVGLTREQATLYRATTRAILSNIERSKGASRRAKVLVLLLRLKQICDHPALFLADGSCFAGRSAKLDRLLSLLEETLAEKRPALLFTQFTGMGDILVSTLKERFGCEVLFLHGSVPRRSRAEMVRRFQEDEEPPPFFVLSLKAGGFGLNLTRASHVFHVDRWWNPAVEDQATDRAFRLGQTRNVQVHKFVCRGTLEERIDTMLEEKKELARSIVGAGETWITELGDAELRELVSLSRDAVDEESRS